MASAPIPAGGEWFIVDWSDVWQRLGLAPHQVPGVQPVTKSPAMMQHPHRVHLTHLRMLGYDLPPGRVTVGPKVWIDRLRPHQVAGVDYIQSRRGTLLADEMRVGKTATTMYSHNPDDGCMFVIGPLAARAVWHEWAARRFGQCGAQTCSICARVTSGVAPDDMWSFTALEGRKLDGDALEEAKGSRVVFAHYAIVPTWRALFDSLPIGTLVVDEIHLPQSGMQSRKSVTCESIRFLNTVAKRSVFLSGSPLWNKPKGLWHILDMLNPGAWGDYWTFARRYADAKPGPHGWRADGSSNEQELQTRLREVMLRRTWKDIAGSLPPINRTVEVVAIPLAVRDRVEETAARLRSVSGGEMRTVVGDLARLRKMYAHEKASAAVVKAREALADGHSVIIWTWHRDVAEWISRLRVATTGDQLPAVAPVAVINGDMPAAERETVIEQLRATAATRPVCLVATMGALATAVNLSFADVEIFAELDWNPDSIAQAEMRPYDGTRPISCVYLVADCDVDQKLADALLAKFEVKEKLGVTPGVGSVADVLSASIGVSNARTLDALADAVLAELGDG